MLRTKGFTLIELMIVIAIIAIIVVLLLGAFARDAGASPLFDKLAGVDYAHNSTAGVLTIINNNGRFASAAAACEELKPVDATLTTVVISDNSGTTDDTAITWSEDGRTLSNLQGRDIAECS